MDRVLLLNADYTPIKTLSWERAVTLLVQGRVYLVESLADKVVRSPSTTMPWPSVVALERYVRVVQSAPSPTRTNVLARDGYRCQYCGVGPDALAHLPAPQRLTIDHVVPVSRARRGMVQPPGAQRWVPVGAWENVVTACGPCNGDKGARLPSEAGLTLRTVPRAPEAHRVWLSRVGAGPVPETWRPYLTRAA